MKTYSLFVAVLFLALTLSACGGAGGTPTATQSTVSGIYTSVAVTLTAQAALVTPTDTALPTDTPTPAETDTEFPTLSIVTATTAYTDGGVSGGSSGAVGCDNAAYVSDVTIPDGTIMAPGQSFVKTWEFQNTGTCTWTTSYELAFVSSDQMGGTTTSLSASVAPGEQGEASVSLVAPDTEGTYTGYWHLVNDQGNAFGDTVYVQIVVSNNASTLTPTLTITPTGSTATATNTPSGATATKTSPTATATTKPGSTPPSSTPVTPSATPVTPTATPVTPSATPVTPTATPVTPSATPITPTATSGTP